MSSSAPNTNSDPGVNNSWSLPDPPQNPIGSQPVKKPGRPGISGSESGSPWETAETTKNQEQASEIYIAPELSPAPELDETGEKYLTPETTNQKPEPENTSTVKVGDPRQAGNVVDKRTNKEKTHRVDITNADSITKTADIKEQEFIEGVETIHSIL